VAPDPIHQDGMDDISGYGLNPILSPPTSHAT